MDQIIGLNGILLICIGAVAVLRGLDLRSWTTWLLAAYMFASGFLYGLVRANLVTGLELGAMVTIGVLFSGALTRWRHKYYEREGPRIVERYQNEVERKLKSKKGTR